jgi:hypothetical protein
VTEQPATAAGNRVRGWDHEPQDALDKAAREIADGIVDGFLASPKAAAELARVLHKVDPHFRVPPGHDPMCEVRAAAILAAWQKEREHD